MDYFVAKTRSDALVVTSLAVAGQPKTFDLAAVCAKLAEHCNASLVIRACVLRTAWMLKACYNPTSQHMDDHLCEHLARPLRDIKKLLELNDAQADAFMISGLNSVIGVLGLTPLRAPTKEEIKTVAREGIRMLMDNHVVRMAMTRDLEVANRAVLRSYANACDKFSA